MFSNKALKSLLIPLIIEQFLAISLGIADTMMVSTVGESAVSGVSLVDMLNVLIIDIFAGLASGGAVVAIYRREKQARKRALLGTAYTHSGDLRDCSERGSTSPSTTASPSAVPLGRG